jgi:hypothetical protein
MMVGQPAGGWTEPDANAVFAAVADSALPALRHELGHLYSHRLWGYPHADWLSEGVAVFAAGHCAGIPLHRWAAAILRSGDDSSLGALEREFDFSRSVPHLLAGSFITFLAEDYGLEAVQILWRDGLASAQRATGANAAAPEAKWHAELRRVDVPLDMPEFRGRLRCENGAGCRNRPAKVRCLPGAGSNQEVQHAEAGAGTSFSWLVLPCLAAAWIS